MGGRPWGRHEIAAADRLVRSGMAVWQIAAALGRTAQAVKAMRHRRGRNGEEVPELRQERPWIEAEIIEADRMIRDGALMSQVGERLGRSADSVSGMRKTRRRRGEHVPAHNLRQVPRGRRFPGGFDLLETDEL